MGSVRTINKTYKRTVQKQECVCELKGCQTALVVSDI